MSTEMSRSTRCGCRRKHPWADGYTIFAVATMFVLGLWQALAGISAVVRDGLYVTAPGYVHSFDMAAWGWMILLLGVLTAGDGRRRPAGPNIGRHHGVASLSLIANFLLIPATRSGHS